MTTALSHPARLLRRGAATTAVAALVALGLTAPTTSSSTGAASAEPAISLADASATQAVRKAAANPPTPGNFTGYGFDQCLTPSQTSMDRWLESSPYLAAGIYISGDSRACRNQPNLTPTWVATQLSKGWHLLAITLGPQASCQPRFPRYSDDFTISPKPGGAGNYSAARTMGQNSAATTIADARALGLVPGSTLWYDLEGFDNTNTDCRESALAFISAWVKKVKAAGYVTGVYSSASSGIKVLDDARVNRPAAFALPDRIWVARWDGAANTSTSYIRDDGWRPRNRVKQYQGGHDETWGGVRINIDTNYLDLGQGSVAPVETHCGGVVISFPTYAPLAPKTATKTPPTRMVKALQCLLTERGLYAGQLNGVYNQATVRAVNAWQTQRGVKVDKRWFRRDWTSVLSFGRVPILKFGSAGGYVRRVQRALNAATDSPIKATGVYDATTTAAVKRYQAAVKVPTTGNVDPRTWAALRAGKR